MAYKMVYNPAIVNSHNVKGLSAEPAEVIDGTIKSNDVAVLKYFTSLESTVH